ncbi:MAG TPA: long-chain fatty acid--CoA ligase [Acidimicrobiales bacterium]
MRPRPEAGEAGVGATGPAGATVVDLFSDRVAGWAGRPALREHVDGRWRAITWAEYGRTVAEAAAGLVELGVGPGERVGILAGNQPRWHMADLAVLSAGAVSVPAYPTGASSQVAYVLDHAGCRACFVGDRDQLAKLLLVHRRLPALERLVLLGPAPDGLDDELLLTFDDLCALGRDRLARDPDAVAARSAAIEPASLATIVYTSGTTGPPKGVLITHANVTATIDSLVRAVAVGPDDRFLSFLPLSHIAERVVSHLGQIVSGGETWFARGLATLAEDLRACRPTIFFGVPRVWEKFQAAVEDELDRAPRPVRALAGRYLDLGHRWAGRTLGAPPLRLRDLLAYLALDRTVGARLRAGLGLDRARLLVSAAAPIDPELVRWFHGIGLPVAEVYGQTEVCGPTTMNRPGRIRLGTVGQALPGVEVRIAEDGEVLVRGPNVCRGYHDDPAATEALLTGGWLHSGDLGTLDADGYLRITGRTKDLIVTSSGKNIAPQDMETRLRSEPLISQAIVVGDGRPYLVALLALDVEAAMARTGSRGGHPDLEDLAAHPAVERELREAVARLNVGRAPIEQIKAWRVLPRELTVAGGELTPTLKVRRDVVAARFHDLIEQAYARR